MEECRAIDKDNKEPFEELIDMDLKRSVEFFDNQNYAQIKLLLMNVALTYKDQISYYQGMNYIAIFLYESFLDETKAFHFYCYLAELILNHHFSSNFTGLVKLIWISDKIIQINSPSLWDKLRNGSVSSIHFAVPNIITLFASLVKNRDSRKYICEIWDMMLFEGLFTILKALVYVLEIQKEFIDKIDSDMLLMSMKNVESDPFAIIREAGVTEEQMKEYMEHLNKPALRKICYDINIFTRLQTYYDDVVEKIHKFWS